MAHSSSSEMPRQLYSEFDPACDVYTVCWSYFIFALSTLHDTDLSALAVAVSDMKDTKDTFMYMFAPRFATIAILQKGQFIAGKEYQESELAHTSLAAMTSCPKGLSRSHAEDAQNKYKHSSRICIRIYLS